MGDKIGQGSGQLKLLQQILEKLPGDNVDNVKAENDRLKAENEALKNQIAEQDKPIHHKERRSLLLIIAALLPKNSINYKERGAIQRIRETTERQYYKQGDKNDIAYPVSDDAISKALEKLTEILEDSIPL